MRCHLREPLNLLIQHGCGAIDLGVVKLLEHRGRFIVADVRLPVLILGHEDAEWNVEANAMILLEELLAHCGVAHEKQCGFSFRPVIESMFPWST